MRTNGYNVAWRWHFYAGLFTLPFLMLLASTGSIYLFKDEISQIVYRDLLEVEPLERRLSSEQIVAHAIEGQSAMPTGYRPPASSTDSARVVVRDESGNSRFIFVDPYRGTVLGEASRDPFGNLPLMGLIRSLHSLELVGWFGNRMIELVAGWAVILVLTGVWLWWPRGSRGGVVSVRRNAGRRVFWRDLHAVTGVFAGFFILFLALTGLPWSGFWGENLKHALNEAGLGYPPGFWFPVAKSETHLHETAVPAPWTISNLPLPASEAMPAQPLGLDAMLEIYAAAGMPGGFSVNYPMGPTGVWSASVIPDQVELTRTMHLDQYSGKVLFDARYSDLGAASKVIEWGTSVHTGQQFGRVNQLVMLLTCLAIIGMSLAAILMWWKRRPTGSLGAPSVAEDSRMPMPVLVILVVFGIIFPLTGLSILLVFALDAVLPRFIRDRLA